MGLELNEHSSAYSSLFNGPLVPWQEQPWYDGHFHNQPNFLEIS